MPLYATTPYIDNVTDKRRYSPLVSDFRSISECLQSILTICFLEKKAFWTTILEGLFQVATPKNKKSFFRKQTTSPRAKSAGSPWISVTSRDIAEVWVLKFTKINPACSSALWPFLGRAASEMALWPGWPPWSGGSEWQIGRKTCAVWRAPCRRCRGRLASIVWPHPGTPICLGFWNINQNTTWGCEHIAQKIVQSLNHSFVVWSQNHRTLSSTRLPPWSYSI